jgi:hypothetical protein
MNKTEQAQQLRLAANIIETGHPFEVERRPGQWDKTSEAPASAWIRANKPIRPVLATPPDGKPLHNPDNLTAEQVGLGYRLTRKGEKPTPAAQVWQGLVDSSGEWQKRDHNMEPYYAGSTYRLPLSVPWPEAKPEPPPFQLPPPPGMRWHREDGWKEGDLPQGYRPLVDGEEIQADDEIKWAMDCNWVAVGGLVYSQANKYGEPKRTTRPLVFAHEGKQWTWHRPGDPMPCDGEALIEAVYGKRKDSRKAADYNWDSHTNVFGWRYADEKPDPYAKLKAAHAAGKVIQVMSAGGWLEPTIPLWTSSPENYRIKPDEIPWIEWHGGECPLKDEVEEWEIMFRDSSEVINSKGCPAQMRWTHEAEKSDGDIVRYRVLKARETALGPEDVPPGSVIRPQYWDGPPWITVSKVCINDCLIEGKAYTWEMLKSWQINRSIPLTGKWDATAWEPCHKPKPLANG